MMRSRCHLGAMIHDAFKMPSFFSFEKKSLDLNVLA